MSIENGERLIRFLRDDPALRERVLAAGGARFEKLSAEAGASCRAFDVVAALIREMSRESAAAGGER
ncbi:MAG: hypothetical protein RIB46_05600 [Pseudomonadales bacterium]